jgi:hypothetical protein
MAMLYSLPILKSLFTKKYTTFSIRLFSTFFFTFLVGGSWGQVTIFSDDFGTSTGATYDTDGAIGTSSNWSMSRSGADWGARIDGNILDLTNDASVTANANGWIFGYRDIDGLSGWNTTLSSNTGTITWEFNMRQIRTDPSGFTSGSYGAAFVLAGTSTTPNTSGNGYAVVLGQSGSTDALRLVSYNNGLQGTLSPNIIASNTTGLNDFGNEYLSIRVTFIPTTNTWELFLRNDGTTAFSDPTSGILTSQGTAVNSTYTSTASMRYIGGYWQGATGSSQTACFDNVYLKKLNSTSSNIITNTNFTYPTNIDYTAYQGTTLSTSNSIEVAQFTIQDGGGSADVDALTTELTALTLSVANSGSLRRIALFDVNTNLAEVAGGSSAAFTGLALSAADDGSKTFSVRVSFLSSVTDNQQFSFTVNSATANSSGSTFAAANAGAAVSSTSGDINRIEVSTTDIIFDQNVSNVPENGVMSPSPTVSAVDGNVNFDLDNTSNVVMTISSGSTSFGGTATTTVAMVAGTATFSNLVFSTSAGSNALTATQGAFTDVSSNFNVTASAPEINVKQNVTSIASGSGSHAAGSIVSGNSGSAITFTIENLGSANLTYSSITSSNSTDFTLDLAVTSTPIVPSGTTTFTVTFNPSTAGAKTTTISILNNDIDEDPYTFTITGTGTVSSASDLITNAGFLYSSNIAYASFQTASTLTTTNSVAVNGLTLRDGGATADADNLATSLTAISFTTGGSTAIRTAALFDGTTNIAEVAVNGTTTISFSGLTLSASDASTKDFELRVTYQATVTDNQQITFTVSSASSSASASGFASANAGGAASSITGDRNKLEVTADRLTWVQQPAAVNTGASMSPSPTISANDANSNRDLDYTSTITLTPSASTISTGGSTAAVSGLATFSGLQFSSAVNGVTLSGADGLLISTGNSSSFNITIQEPGLLLFEDNFSHSAILTSTGYIASSGTGTNNLTAGATGLTYPNYGSSSIGNALVVANTGQDVYRTFTQQNSPTTVYASFLVNVSAALTGDYVFAFAPSISASNYRARTFVKASTNTGFVNFGISNTGSGNYNSTPTDYALNTTHLVVVKYSFTAGTTATATVFINPNTTTEPSSGEVSFTDNTIANVPTDIISFTIRQGSSTAAPSLIMDGIRIATNWGALMGNPQYTVSSNIATGNYNNVNVISGTLTTTGGTATVPGNVTVHGTITNNGIVSTSTYNTLTINGTISGSGQIDASSGTIAFGNATNLSFPTGVFTGNIANLSKTSGAGTLTLNDALTTVGNLSTTAGTGAVILAANQQLTVSGTLTNDGTLTIESGATFKQGSSVTGSGTYNVKQTIDNGAGSGSTLSGRFWYLGSPLICTRSSAFGASGNLNKVWQFSNGAYSNVADGSSLSPTTGYVHRRSDASSTLTFSGQNLYAQDVTLSLSNNAGTYGGWHLVSNPYTAYLNWNQIVSNSTGISNTYYIRSYHSSNQDVNALISYNASSGLESNTSSFSLGSAGSTTAQYIAPLQAFWVKVPTTSPLSATAGQLNLQRAFTSHQTGTLKNTGVYPVLARVNLYDGAKFDQMLVYMNEYMTNAVDQNDSEKMFVSGVASIYTMASGKKLVMNGLKNNKKKISVPLYLELPTSKVYQLQLSEYIMEDGLILLEDKQEGTMQDFTIHDTYAFYANSGMLSNRFVLHFFMPDATITAQGPSNSWVQDENEVNEGGSILVSSNGRGKVTIQQDIDPIAADGSQVLIRDASGRMIYEGQLEGTQTSLQLDAPSGVYFVEVQLNGQVEVKKIFVQQ